LFTGFLSGGDKRLEYQGKPQVCLNFRRAKMSPNRNLVPSQHDQLANAGRKD